MLGPTAHTDTFARDNLPPLDQWPDFRFDGLDYPDPMNAAVELTDRMVERGFGGDHTALAMPAMADAAPTRSSPTGAIGWPGRLSRITASSPEIAC